MKEYNEKYKVTKENGYTCIAYLRKGEDYDWWEEVKTGKEIFNVVEHSEAESEWTEEQNEIIGQKFDGLMETVFSLIDELYKKGEDNFTEGEQKFYDAFHEYIFALSDEDGNELDDDEELE